MTSMNAKHITEITIENFRGFGHLELKGLQAVNLIVGQNNVGKTTLLEALTAVAAPTLIEKMPGMFRANTGNVQDRFFRWLLADTSSNAQIIATTPTGEYRTTMAHGDLPGRAEDYGRRMSIGQYNLGWSPNRESLRVRIISVQHRSPSALVPSFADTVRSPESERLMETLLSKVDSRIRSVRLDYAEQEPFIALDIGLSERVPLAQAGQGIYRLVAIFSELLGLQPQVCMIDEIENGIHFTMHKQVWRGLAEISALLGIQMFITTHSRECMEAAQYVFYDEDKESKRDLAVIQLMRVRDRVIGKVLDETSVEGALENHIELR